MIYLYSSMWLINEREGIHDATLHEVEVARLKGVQAG